MDFGKAALLIAAVFGVVEFGKRFLGPKLAADSRIIAALALVVGQAATWLMAETAWAHEQVIGTKPLDELNTASKILVGIFVAGVAAFGAEFLASVRDVGVPMPTRAQKAALDKGAAEYAAGQMPDGGGSHDTDEYGVDRTTVNFEKPTP